MSTIHSITVAFEEVSNQASSLSDCAAELRNVQRQLQSLMSELSSGWEGDASAQYLQKCELLKSKINVTASDLDRIATVIRASAKSYYDAERRALEIAQTRSYGGEGSGC